MSLTSLQGIQWVPSEWYGNEGVAGGSSSPLDADGEMFGSICKIPKTGTLTKIAIRLSTVTTGDTLKISLQTVDATTGFPTGSLYVANASGTVVVGGGDDYVTKWVEINSGTGVSVSRGDVVAVVYEYDSYVAGNLTLRVFGSGAQGFPYNAQNIGGWAMTNQQANIAFQYDDTTLETGPGVYGALFRFYKTYNNGDTPDRYGLRFKFPYACRLSAFTIYGDFDGDINVKLYDTDGTTVLETVSLDKDLRGYTATRLSKSPFANFHELLANAYYRVVVLPTTATDISLYGYDVTDDGAVKGLSALQYGTDFCLTEASGNPTVEGDWTQTDTQRPYILLGLDQIDLGGAVRRVGGVLAR